MSTVIALHIPCESGSCTSSNGMTLYSDGHVHCFVCGYNTQGKVKKLKDTEEFEVQQKNDFHQHRSIAILQDIDKTKFRDISDRSILKSAAQAYNVWINDEGEHVYPYFSGDRKTHVANKFRNTKIKGFQTQGDIKGSGLFGQQLFDPGSAKQITITEGELDAISVYQMTGQKFPCVSIKGASSACKDIADNFQWVDSFDQIVLCFDKDEPHTKSNGTVWYPGQEAAEKVAQMFKPGKVRVLTLKKGKDANEYLMKGMTDDFVREWWAAPAWSPVGLKNAFDMWDEVIKKDVVDSIAYPWDGVNKLTYGIRPSELVIITANPGVGKTLLLNHISYAILQKILSIKDDARCVGLMMLENSKKETLLGLMSLAANKPLHLPDIQAQVPEPEVRKYFDQVYGDRKVILWDHFGSNDIDKVLSFVRYLANLGCKHIVLDHLSIVVSDQHGDERKQLDEISTKLKTLTMELGIAVIAIVHQNRKGEIRGTMGIEQLANIVIKLYRDVKNDDETIRNITKVTVEKNRFSGKTGPACLLRYDAETGQLLELTQDDLQQYLKSNKERKDDSDDEW